MKNASSTSGIAGYKPLKTPDKKAASGPAWRGLQPSHGKLLAEGVPRRRQIRRPPRNADLLEKVVARRGVVDLIDLAA